MTESTPRHQVGPNGFVPDQDTLYHYIQRKLSPAEEERVELWLMDNPDAVEALELDLALKEGMKEIRPKSQTRSRAEGPAWLAWLTRPGFAGATAFAVLAAIATPTVLYLGANDRNEALASRIAMLERPSTSVYQHALKVSRSVGNDPIDARVVLGDEPFVVLLDVDVTPWQGRYEKFGLTVATAQEQIKYTDPGVSPTGAIRLAMHSEALDVGRMDLILTGISASGERTELNRYRIEVAGD